VLATARQRFNESPPLIREAQLAALEHIASELAKTFRLRSARFVERRFYEVIGLRVR
jgi:hypothetical protein